MSLFFNSRDPWSEMRKMQREMDRMWDSLDHVFLPTTTASITNSNSSEVIPHEQSKEVSTQQWRPVIDVKSNDKEVFVHAELPGVRKEDISLELKVWMKI